MLDVGRSPKANGLSKLLFISGPHLLVIHQPAAHPFHKTSGFPSLYLVATNQATKISWQGKE